MSAAENELEYQNIFVRILAVQTSEQLRYALVTLIVGGTSAVLRLRALSQRIQLHKLQFHDIRNKTQLM